MKLLGHERVTYLKMDIERSEFEVISAFKHMRQENVPSQIAFEVHLANAYGRFQGHVSKIEWDDMFSTLDNLSYGVFAHDHNPRCRCCCEFSLILKSKVDSLAD